MRISFRHSALLLTSILATSLPQGFALAEDNEPEILVPLTRWNLDMGENSCRIARHLGSAEQPTIFYMEQWSPSNRVTWMVAGGAVSKFRDDDKTRFAFGPDGDSGESATAAWNFANYGNALRHSSPIVAQPVANGEQVTPTVISRDIGLLQIDSASADGISQLTLSQDGHSDVALELGNLKAPLEAMNACMANLVTSWGYDLDLQRTIVSRPSITNYGRVARRIMENYPASAHEADAQANFLLRLGIDEEGELKDCVLLNQTLADDFDMERHPCSDFKRTAEFIPAQNAAGEPVESYHVVRIVYRLVG